jgi:IstB-like ATP binding protein
MSAARCNRSVEWRSVFGDPVVATAILDRLLHHSQGLRIRGGSDRLRQKRCSGLIKTPAFPEQMLTSVRTSTAACPRP